MESSSTQPKPVCCCGVSWCREYHSKLSMSICLYYLVLQTLSLSLSLLHTHTASINTASWVTSAFEWWWCIAKSCPRISLQTDMTDHFRDREINVLSSLSIFLYSCIASCLEHTPVLLSKATPQWTNLFSLNIRSDTQRSMSMLMIQIYKNMDATELHDIGYLYSHQSLWLVGDTKLDDSKIQSSNQTITPTKSIDY